jgi:uncharacterized protein YgbK (DUF1537 family)
MKDHPLTPMRDSNLARLLQPQTTWSIKQLSHYQLGHIAEVDRGGTPCHVIVDAIDEADLHRIAHLARDHVLLTGSSGIGGPWAKAIGITRALDSKDRCLYSSHMQDDAAASLNGFTVILAGSCSTATRAQTAEFEDAGGPTLKLNVGLAATDETAFEDELQRVVQWCLKHTDRPAVLVESGRDPQAVRDLSNRLGPGPAAAAVERLFAAVACQLAKHGVRRWIVAGGETSGAVIRALNVEAVLIGPEIDAGVLWVRSLDDSRYWLALKSGNFGKPSFFADALNRYEEHAKSMEPCNE